MLRAANAKYLDIKGGTYTVKDGILAAKSLSLTAAQAAAITAATETPVMKFNRVTSMVLRKMLTALSTEQTLLLSVLIQLT
jgi:hypothetical protein